jgi:hypothetical protein
MVLHRPFEPTRLIRSREFFASMKSAMRWKFSIKLLTGLLFLFAVLVFFSPSFHDKHFGVARYEAAAVGSLDKINSLENKYAASHPDKGFTCELAALRPQEGGSDKSDQISGLLTGQWGGYKFTFAGCTPEATGIVSRYQIFAVPIRAGRTGIRAFCTDQTGKLFYDLSGSPSECLASRREIP